MAIPLPAGVPPLLPMPSSDEVRRAISHLSSEIQLARRLLELTKQYEQSHNRSPNITSKPEATRADR